MKIGVVRGRPKRKLRAMSLVVGLISGLTIASFGSFITGRYLQRVDPGGQFAEDFAGAMDIARNHSDPEARNNARADLNQQARRSLQLLKEVAESGEQGFDFNSYVAIVNRTRQHIRALESLAKNAPNPEIRAGLVKSADQLIKQLEPLTDTGK